jgi:hypothetical protein
MSTKKHRPIMVCVSDATRAQEVQQEIENFLRALNSYPDEFAHDPRLSFEQHLLSMKEMPPTNGGGEDCQHAS